MSGSTWQNPMNRVNFILGRDGGAQTCTLYFDGVPAGTDQVVLRFYQNIQEGEVLAEFTIDLSDQTAVPSTTYQDGGVLDLDGPFLYYFISWAKKGSLSLPLTAVLWN